MRRVFAIGLIVLLLLAAAPAAFGQEPLSDPAVGLELVADGFAAPLALMPSGDGSGRLFIMDQVGQIWILSPEGNLLEQPFLDVSDRMVELSDNYDERGLLGLAFHPNYAENGRFYVYYSAPLRDSAPADWDHTSHVSEFVVSETDANLVSGAKYTPDLVQNDGIRYDMEGANQTISYRSRAYVSRKVRTCQSL
jgi:hypothetical protein